MDKHPQSHIFWANLAYFSFHENSIEVALQLMRKSNYIHINSVKPRLTNNILNHEWNNADFMRPSFMIIGSMKCGTTSLYNYITQHQNIVPSIWKEIQYFRVSKPLSKGLDWYLSHFPSIPAEILEHNDVVTGEASPNYFTTERAPQEIYDVFPNIKLIVILRDPVDRAISHYHHWIRVGNETKSLEEAFYEELDLLENIQDFSSNNVYSLVKETQQYLLKGLYILFLKNWLALFPKENMLILRTKDLADSPATVLHQVFKHLNLSTETNNINYDNKKNTGSYQQIDSKLKNKLTSFYDPFNKELENFLNIKL
jgi:hypothetical protein